MEVVYPRCCGLDVHKKSIAACVIIREQGKAQKLERRFGTFTSDLEELAEWLEEFGVTHVVMEATGVYWKPVWNVLEGQFELMLVNPQHVKALSGKKFDRKDASHLAELLQHGLLQGSFVPSVEIRQLRDLTRNRARTVQETVRIKNRIDKILEEANIKLSSVATDLFGVSGRLMLKQLIAGEQDATKLAGLARGRLKSFSKRWRESSAAITDGCWIGCYGRWRRGRQKLPKTNAISGGRSNHSTRRCRHGSSCQGSRMSRPGRWWRRWGPTWPHLILRTSWHPGPASARAIMRAPANSARVRLAKAIPGFGMRLVKPLGEPPKRRSPTSTPNTIVSVRGAATSERSSPSRTV